MSAPSQFLLFRETISSHIFLQLRSLWHETGKKWNYSSFFVTERELLSLAEQNSVINIQNSLHNEKFSLLITPKFNALLSGSWQPLSQDYQIQITFDSITIRNYISRFKNSYKYSSNIVEYLTSNLNSQINDYDDYLQSFINQLYFIINNSHSWQKETLLLEDNHPCCLDGIAVKKMPNYQLESKQIIDQVHNQIEQKVDLLDIIQMTIERVLMLLQLDRLVIYQLDVSLQNIESNISHVNTVTWESKSSELVESILDFRDENYFGKSSKCYLKYRQGFSLVVNDIKNSSTFTPCLQNLMEKMQVKAKVVTPINLQNKLWGLLIAHQCFSIRQWHPSETKFLRDIAKYIAVTIHQDNYYKLLRQQNTLLKERVNTQAHQIKDALVAAQIANQSKHEFIDNMSHEFKTPLTCIIGLSGTLMHWTSNDHKSLPIEKQHKYLKNIQENGKKLLKLVNNILELSEVESGKHLLNITRFYLQDILQHIMPILNQEAQYKSIEFKVDFQNITPKDFIYADQDRLEEILLNIVGNGIKFTPPEGQVYLNIIKESSQIIFQVEDTGIGISQQQIHLLFKKFQQLEYSRRRIYGGAGLGLALTKHLVELHGGNIEVESVIGKGSVFTVYLPIKKTKNIELVDKTRLSKKSKTIVLITQDEEISTFLCEVLTAAGYQVVWLVDSSVSSHQIQLLDPLVILLDKDCPEINLEIISDQIRKKVLSNKIKLVLLCDEMSTADWQHFSKYNVYDYLLKSMSFTQILNKIYTII